MTRSDHKADERRRLQAEQERFFARGGAFRHVDFGTVRGNIYDGPRRHDYLFAGHKTR